MTEYLGRDVIAGLIEGRNEIRVAMPGDIRELVDDIVGRLIAVLGESPEAWRGALEAIEELLMRPLMTYHADDEKGELSDAPRAFITMVMIVLGQFMSNELTLANLKMIHEQNKEKES